MGEAIAFAAIFMLSLLIHFLTMKRIYYANRHADITYPTIVFWANAGILFLSLIYLVKTILE